MDVKNQTQLENERIGTEDWKLVNPALNREIEGYASSTSITAGEKIEIYFSTQSEKVCYSLYRMGWYNGLGGRLYFPKTEVIGIQQEMPVACKNTGLIECHWKNPIVLHIKEDWPSGIYVLKLEELRTHRQSYVIFVVKDKSCRRDILFQLPVTTYQAYNYWGGKSLYDWGSGSELYWGHKYGERAKKVSFNRPYVKSNNPKAIHGVGAGEFFTNIQPVNTHFYPTNSAGWDYNMVRWLEKNGYDVGYISNIDTHSDFEHLTKSKIFLSHGHDEYWSSRMRRNVSSLKDYGVNLAFFSANTMFWQIRFESSSSGIANRTMICYKDKDLDPEKGDNSTVNFRDEPVSNPEARLLGIQYCIDPVEGDIVISNPDHPIFSGFQLKKGDKLEGLLGYEVDGICEASPSNIEVLASSRVSNKIYGNPKIALNILYHKIILKLLDRMPFRNSISVLKFKSLISALCFLLLTISTVALFFISELYLILFYSALFSILSMIVTKLTKNQNKGLVKNATSNVTLYSTEESTKVFAAGTIQWAWGLDDYNVPQLRRSRQSALVDKITKRIFSFLGVEPS